MISIPFNAAERFKSILKDRKIGQKLNTIGTKGSAEEVAPQWILLSAKKKRFRRTAILYVAMHPTLHKSSTRYLES